MNKDHQEKLLFYFRSTGAILALKEIIELINNGSSIKDIAIKAHSKIYALEEKIEEL